MKKFFDAFKKLTTPSVSDVDFKDGKTDVTFIVTIVVMLVLIGWGGFLLMKK